MEYCKEGNICHRKEQNWNGYTLKNQLFDMEIPQEFVYFTSTWESRYYFCDYNDWVWYILRGKIDQQFNDDPVSTVQCIRHTGTQTTHIFVQYTFQTGWKRAELFHLSLFVSLSSCNHPFSKPLLPKWNGVFSKYPTGSFKVATPIYTLQYSSRR